MKNEDLSSSSVSIGGSSLFIYAAIFGDIADTVTPPAPATPKRTMNSPNGLTAVVRTAWIL